MKRREFFKKLGLGAVITAIAPKLMAKKPKGLIFDTKFAIDEQRRLTGTEILGWERAGISGPILPFGRPHPRTRTSMPTPKYFGGPSGAGKSS